MVRDFFLDSSKLECVRSYKYLGFIITPSGEINTGLKDLRDRGFKAFMKIKRDLGIFNQNVSTALLLFNSLVKPIILYCSDFWGPLKIPKSTSAGDLYEYMSKSSPVEKLYSSICKQTIGVQKQTTNIGVLLELGVVPLFLYSIKFSINNWERIRNGNANPYLLSAFHESNRLKLPWSENIYTLIDSVGMNSLRVNDYSDKPPFIHKKMFQRMSDLFHQNSFEKINCESHKLRSYAIFRTKTGLMLQNDSSLQNFVYQTIG